MENTQSSVSQVSIKYGIILGVVFIVFSLLLFMSGNFGNQWLGAVQYLFLIAGIVFAHNDFKRNGDGFMSYGQGLGIGTLTTLVSAVFSSIFTYIYMAFIDTNILEEMKEAQILELESQGMSDAQIEQALGFMTPGVIIVIAILFFVFIGFILSLIISAFTKNNNPELQI